LHIGIKTVVQKLIPQINNLLGKKKCEFDKNFVYKPTETLLYLFGFRSYSKFCIHPVWILAIFT